MKGSVPCPWLRLVAAVVLVACEATAERPVDGDGEQDPPAGGGGGSGGQTTRRPDAAGGAASGNDAGPVARADAAAPAGRDGGPQPPGTTTPYAAPKVVVSEIMYHPAAENAATEEHEFLEIANRTDGPVEIGGWKIEGTISYAFPAKLTLAAKQHLVIARNPQALAPVWGLAAGSLQGPYMGQLDNGGGRVALVDAAGALVDEVRYADTAPWPMGADAFGAGEAWLAPALRPLTKHQHKGYSLERVSYEVSGNEPVNWTTSLLDASTPGKPNAASAKPHDAIAERVSHEAKADATRTIEATDQILVRVVLSGRGTAKAPVVEYFVDDLERTGEEKKTVPLAMTGAEWQATLPPQAASSIVRYRILADRGGGTADVIAPRPTDPYAWFAYFVDPRVGGKTPAYHFFISKRDWSQLWTNIVATRVPTGKCDPNPTWNNKVPAVLVHGGKVIDVQARYQGSPYNRMNGPAMTKPWPADKAPANPSPMKALSWHFSLPRYAPINGSRDVILNKRANECSFLTTGVGGKVMESLGLPSSRVTYARLYVNGVYYHYMTAIEHMDEDMLKRFFGKDHAIGDLFKVVGWNGESGPYTWADGRELAGSLTTCKQFTPEQLYAFNYDRSTPEHKVGAEEVRKLIGDMRVAITAGPAAIRAFFDKNFDVKLLTNYVAAINWMMPWDDFFQNHFLYRRADGKWIILPWDYDHMFGGYSAEPNVPAAHASFNIGVAGDRSNRIEAGVKWKNDMKEAFIKTFRTELQARWRELVAKELAPATIDAYINEQLAAYSIDEARASQSGAFCDPKPMVDRMKKFTVDRNARVAANAWD